MNRYTKILIPETFRYNQRNLGEAPVWERPLPAITVDRVDRTASIEGVGDLEIDFEWFVRHLLVELTANSDYIFNRGILRRAAFNLYHALGGEHVPD